MAFSKKSSKIGKKSGYLHLFLKIFACGALWSSLERSRVAARPPNNFYKKKIDF